MNTKKERATLIATNATRENTVTAWAWKGSVYTTQWEVAWRHGPLPLNCRLEDSRESWDSRFWLLRQIGWVPATGYRPTQTGEYPKTVTCYLAQEGVLEDFYGNRVGIWKDRLLPKAGGAVRFVRMQYLGVRYRGVSVSGGPGWVCQGRRK